MTNLKRSAIVCILLILLIALYINHNYSRTIDEAFYKAGINYNEIIDIKEVKKGSIVFYKINSNIGIVYMDKLLSGWSLKATSGFIDFTEPNTWHYSSRKINKIRHKVIYGIIQNKNIKEVCIKIIDQKNNNIIDNNIAPELIKSNGLGTFWYVLLEDMDYRFKTSSVDFTNSKVPIIKIYVKR